MPEIASLFQMKVSLQQILAIRFYDLHVWLQMGVEGCA
jgi:hypothetical protein